MASETTSVIETGGLGDLVDELRVRELEDAGTIVSAKVVPPTSKNASEEDVCGAAERSLEPR